MKQAAILLALYACLGSAAASSASQPPADAAEQRVRQLLTQRRDELGIPGMTVTVVRDGRIAFTFALGMADAEYNVPATADTVYRIGGISKPLTAVTVLDLVHRGRLSLDASLRDYVPELPDKGHPITIEQALGHLSGLRRERNVQEWRSRTAYPTLVSSIEPFAKDPLVTRPGEHFIFSNYGYTLLGLVIERVTSLPFDLHMRREILVPMGMTSTGLEEPATILPSRARGYLRADGVLRHAPFVDLSVRAPGSGLVSTAPDLAAFAIALLEGRLLGDALRTKMLTPVQPADGKSPQYGLGWFVREDAGRRIVGHSGPEVGFSSMLVVWPEEKAAVVLLSNLEAANVAATTLDVGRIILGIEQAGPAPAIEEP